MSEEEAKTTEETNVPETTEEGETAKEEESTAHFEPVVSRCMVFAYRRLFYGESVDGVPGSFRMKIWRNKK